MNKNNYRDNSSINDIDKKKEQLKGDLQREYLDTEAKQKFARQSMVKDAEVEQEKLRLNVNQNLNYNYL